MEHFLKLIQSVNGDIFIPTSTYILINKLNKPYFVLHLNEYKILNEA